MSNFTVYIDGASWGNPGHSGVGVVIYNKKDKSPLRAFGYYIGKLTNNMAEYTAAIFAVVALLELDAEDVTIFSDSELLVRQLNGEYRVKNEKLIPFYLQLKFFLRCFRRVSFCYLNRKENRLADELAHNAISRRGYVEG